MNSYEVIIFVIDMIVNADDREKVATKSKKPLAVFETLSKEEPGKAMKPVLCWNILTALLDANYNTDEQLAFYNKVNEMSTKLYPSDSFMLTKLKIKKAPIQVRAL